MKRRSFLGRLAAVAAGAPFVPRLAPDVEDTAPGDVPMGDPPPGVVAGEVRQRRRGGPQVTVHAPVPAASSPWTPKT